MTTVCQPCTDRGSQLFTDYDYVRFRQLLEERCGLCFPENRRSDLERGVRQAFASSTCADLDDYTGRVQDPDGGAVLFDQLVNTLTVGETHFMRDAGQMDALFNHVLPQIIERRRLLRTLRIWSAGCADGPEPYSVAMLLHELLPDLESWSVTILGTDINTEALDSARKAAYGEWAFREESAKLWRSRCFVREGRRFALIRDVRRMVTFARLNLAESRCPAYQTNTSMMDLILCRNVLMYLTESTARAVVDRFHQCLADGGWLVVGAAEHSPTAFQRFETRDFPGAVLYQRVDQPALALRGADRTASQPAAASPRSKRGPARRPVALQPDLLPGADKATTLAEDDRPIEQAKQWLELGRTEEARDVLLQLAESWPRSPEVCMLLGRAYANLGFWKKAEQWCQRAVRLNNLALDAYYVLALVLEHEGEPKEAIAAMRKVLYLDHDHLLGHVGLAHLYRTYGQQRQALKSLDNARRLLEGRNDDELVPGSNGVTAARLRTAVVGQLQEWSAEPGAGPS